MIALILAAHLAYRPFVMTWAVAWGGKYNPTTHSASFATAEDAVAAYEAAPMCEGDRKPPCVLWARLDYIPMRQDKDVGFRP